jgi:hypothetical protein
MTDAPGELDAAQHAEYHISVAPPKGRDASSPPSSLAEPPKKAERAAKESVHTQASTAL